MTSTEELGHQITRIIADAATDVLARVASFTGEQAALALTPRRAAGEPEPDDELERGDLVSFASLTAIMEDIGIATCLIPNPVMAALVKRLNRLHGQRDPDPCWTADTCTLSQRCPHYSGCKTIESSA